MRHISDSALSAGPTLALKENHGSTHGWALCDRALPESCSPVKGLVRIGPSNSWMLVYDESSVFPEFTIAYYQYASRNQR